MLSSSAQADFHAVECLSTPCQFCARLCTSDCSKSGLVGGLDRITCAHNLHATNNLNFKALCNHGKSRFGIPVSSPHTEVCTIEQCIFAEKSTLACSDTMGITDMIARSNR